MSRAGSLPAFKFLCADHRPSHDENAAHAVPLMFINSTKMFGGVCGPPEIYAADGRRRKGFE